VWGTGTALRTHGYEEFWPVRMLRITTVDTSRPRLVWKIVIKMMYMCVGAGQKG